MAEGKTAQLTPFYLANLVLADVDSDQPPPPDERSYRTYRVMLVADSLAVTPTDLRHRWDHQQNLNRFVRWALFGGQYA